MDALVEGFVRAADGVPTLEEATADGLLIDEAVWEGADEDGYQPFQALYLVDHEIPDGAGSQVGVFAATGLTSTGVESDPIVDGVYIAPQESTHFTESASFYLGDLRRKAGRVKDYMPGSLDPRHWYHLDHAPLSAILAECGLK